MLFPGSGCPTEAVSATNADPRPGAQGRRSLAPEHPLFCRRPQSLCSGVCAAPATQNWLWP